MIEEKDKVIVTFGLPSFIFFFGKEGVREYSILLDLIPEGVTLINFCLIDITDQQTTTYQKSLYDVTVSIKRTPEHPDRYIFEIEHSALHNLTNRIGYMVTEGLLIKDFTMKTKEEYL